MTQWLTKARPEMTLAEYGVRLQLDLEIEASEPTLCRALRFLRLTRKRKVRTAMRKFTAHNMQRIADFRQWQRERDAWSIIFVDEMGVKVADAQRIYARSKAGTKAAVPCPAHNTGERGTLWNFFAALDAEGIMDCTYHTHESVNAATFEDWVEIMLLPTILEKYPFGGVSVVMDNASFHRRVPLTQMFNEHGVELMFLPAYCPEYNPIETAFAWIKAHVRRVPTEAMIDLLAATHRAFESVTENLAVAWMRYSDFVIEE